MNDGVELNDAPNVAVDDGVATLEGDTVPDTVVDCVVVSDFEGVADGD